MAIKWWLLCCCYLCVLDTQLVLLSGSLPAVKLIIEIAGSDCLEQRDANNRTPLMLATMGGHGEVVNLLLSHRGHGPPFRGPPFRGSAIPGVCHSKDPPFRGSAIPIPNPTRSSSSALLGTLRNSSLLESLIEMWCNISCFAQWSSFVNYLWQW